jgi:hypothetical protein
VGDEAKPSTSSIPAALSASLSSMPTAASNNNNSWCASTGRHDLSQRQLVLLHEMLNNANATADVTPEDMEAEVEELVAPRMRTRSGGGGMRGIVRLRFSRRRRGSSEVGRDGVGG